MGSAVGPLIARQFLSPEPSQMDDYRFNVTNESTAENVPTFTNLTENNTTAFRYDTKIQYAYMIVGCFSLISALLFSIAAVKYRYGSFQQRGQNDINKLEKFRRTTKDSRKFRYLLLFIMFLFYVLYSYVEKVLGSFIATFVVEGLGWEKYKGSTITTVLWGSMGVGRLLGIPLSTFFTPRQMAYADIFCTTIAIGGMWLSVYINEVLMWISASLAGMAMGTTYASVILWSEKFITVDGQAGGVFLVGSSVGGMSGPALVGYLFQTFSHMWFIYFTLASGALHVAVFVVMDGAAIQFQKHVKRGNGERNEYEIPSTELKLL